MPVINKLAGLRSRLRKPKKVDNVVEPGFQYLQKYLTGDSPGLLGPFETESELLFR
jgi:hypothetical protein